ncbi:MAG: family 20 glycosylhydrolase, partial [Muribaculaceae bacterium]|nr:family 20 glycosylhydrolase [Muribaculaceae bacterium]
MKRLIFAISVLAASCAAGAVNSGSQVIPKPLSEQFTSDKAFVLTPKSVIAADTQLASQADYLALALGAPTGWDLPVKIGLKKGAIVLTVDTVAAPRAEGYRLSVTPKGVTIAAHDPAGAFYGIQTLLQYFPSEVYSPTRQKGIDWSVPSVVVDDAPDYPFRAMMLDAARYYYEPEYVKRFIDIMAAYKLNKLQFHFIDDCGWRMESK